MCRFLSVALLALTLGACSQGQTPAADAADTPAYVGDRVGHFGFGTPATQEQIAGWDIDIRPDGAGLPEGQGSVEDGEWLYEEQCAECHGSFGEGVGRYPVLAGGEGTLRDARPTRTVGSYWPYTSTLFDYIRRTMPFTQPESLSADDTYAITAYVLYLNDLVEDDLVLTQDNLASIRLPNEANFVADPRPDVSNTRCMQNCRDPEQIEILSEVVPAAPAAAAAQTVAAAQTADPGQKTYDQYCSICHNLGVGGAPVLGEAAQWAERVTRGLDAVAANAINGVTSDAGVMPPKGGFPHLSDDEVTDAVRYMMEKSS